MSDDVRSLIVKANSLLNQFASRGSNYNEDLFTALDYPTVISYEDYVARYLRQDIANRVVRAPVQVTWSGDPKVYESVAKKTPFELAYAELVDRLDLYTILAKVDLLANIGRFSLAYLGLTDSGELKNEPKGAVELSYITALSEGSAWISEWESDLASERYGQPLIYKISFNSPGGESVTELIHWSRIIHVAENTLESSIYGSPALEVVYNRLIGLEKIAGGSPEMYWRGARPGYTAQSLDNAIVTEAQRDDISEQLTAFVNNLQRWIYVEGLDIKPLAQQVASPEEHVRVQLQLISAATRIPIRILVGSESGKLASQQDERAWLASIEERRTSVATKLIIRPLIDRLIALKVLPTPVSGDYTVEWDSLVVLSEAEAAMVGKSFADSLSTYVNSFGATDLVPPEIFFKKGLNMSEAEIELALAITGDGLKEEDSLREPTKKTEDTDEEDENAKTQEDREAEDFDSVPEEDS